MAIRKQYVEFVIKSFVVNVYSILMGKIIRDLVLDRGELYLSREEIKNES